MQTHNVNVKTATKESSETGGKPRFYPSAYEPGVSLREDVYQTQFYLEVEGQYTLPEDDSEPGSGKRYCYGEWEFGAFTSLRDAVRKIEAIYAQWKISGYKTDLCQLVYGVPDGHSGRFAPEFVRILDRHNDLALGAVIDQEVQWVTPVATLRDFVEVMNKVDSLNYGWPETRQEKILGLSLIHSRYWKHEEVNALINRTASPASNVF
ncbi:hypothetical protein [Nissabacter sp. SGAir0207]|uniref:hypothetical protein n=1 Tax=Nissabacter sp. SGAir0207 TaxID=2126321 RepID=UPI0010CD6903|nr:hypothetical protein [Nissabacter sp. SGAir0207]QCR38913.1 hypothetical protein C1N62_22650 [Nissabacter sp. SGAir0207]